MFSFILKAVAFIKGFVLLVLEMQFVVSLMHLQWYILPKHDCCYWFWNSETIIISKYSVVMFVVVVDELQHWP